jgi:hypothetical protein
MAGTMESPLHGDMHGGFGERPGETDQQQCRHRAPGRLIPAGATFTDMLVMPVIFQDISSSRCGCPSTELEASRCPCPIRV